MSEYNNNYYFRGQGQIFLSPRTTETATPQSFDYLGNCPDLFISSETELKNHKESYTGQGNIDLVLEINQKAQLYCQLENIDHQNLQLVLHGQATITNSGTITAQKKIYSHSALILQHINITTLVIDNYTENVHYLLDRQTGMITNLTIPNGEIITITYQYQQSEITNSYSSKQPYFWLRFNGLNTVTNEPIIIDIFKTKLIINTDLAYISDKLQNLELTGKIIYDPLQHL